MPIGVPRLAWHSGILRARSEPRMIVIITGIQSNGRYDYSPGWPRRPPRATGRHGPAWRAVSSIRCSSTQRKVKHGGSTQRHHRKLGRPAGPLRRPPGGCARRPADSAAGGPAGAHSGPPSGTPSRDRCPSLHRRPGLAFTASGGRTGPPSSPPPPATGRCRRPRRGSAVTGGWTVAPSGHVPGLRSWPGRYRAGSRGTRR